LANRRVNWRFAATIDRSPSQGGHGIVVASDSLAPYVPRDPEKWEPVFGQDYA